MKAQSSFELLVSVGAFLLFMVPMVFLMLSASQGGLETLSVYSSRNVVQSLSDNLNEVYLQGDGAKRSIILDIPTNARKIYVGNHTATISIMTSSGIYEVSHPFFANVSEFNISSSTRSISGLTAVILTMNNGKVEIRKKYA